MKIARNQRVDNGASARADPRMREVLCRLTQQIRNPDTSVWPCELADIVFMLGKLQMQDQEVSELLRMVAESAKHCVEHFTPQDMAGIVWGFASLGFRNETLMSLIAAEVVNKASTFDQRQVSITAWAFAKCGLWNQQLASSIVGECLAKISSFSAQSLSHLSWALSQWGTRSDELMTAIADESRKKISEFTPAPLAMTAWSFASLQQKDTALLTAISREAVRTMDRFETRDLAHLAWAFANLRVQDAPLFDAMAAELQRTIRGTQPPELANIAWAFSKNNFAHEALMTTIAGEAVLQIEHFKPAEVAMLTWAFAVAGLQHKELMTQIGIIVARRVETFTAPQLSHIAWAFGALALRHSEFLQVLSQHVQSHMGAFRAQGLSNIAWAFAMVTFRDEPLLLRAAPCIARDAAELRPLALARCAWAYRVLTVQSPALFETIAAESMAKVDDFPTKALVKLVDSMYLSSARFATGPHNGLEAALATRMADVAGTLRRAAGGLAGSMAGGAAAAEAYAVQVREHGLVDCGIVGTPVLMAHLGVALPGAAFMKRCRSQAPSWASLCPSGRGEGDTSRPGSTSQGREEYAAAELSVTVGEQQLETWAVRHTAQHDLLEASASHLLLAVDLPSRPGQSEALYLALAEHCAGLARAGVDLGDADARAEVRGVCRVLSTLLPSLSGVGTLCQFAALFPNVSLEFAEQVGTLGDS